MFFCGMMVMIDYMEYGFMPGLSGMSGIHLPGTRVKSNAWVAPISEFT